MLEQAIAYHRLGLGVIPLCPRDKRPMMKWDRYQLRRPTEEEITQWWTEAPDANIGIVTGAVSGIFVLDIDGVEGANSVKDKHLPPTPAGRTSRGTHYYFKHPGGTIKNKVGLLPHVDVRGDGGYVLAPPSIHPSGAVYEWLIPFDDKDSLEDAPIWLLKLCGGSQSAVVVLDEDLSGEDPPEWYEEALHGVSEGRRNDLTAKLAGRYLGNGLTSREALELLMAWNLRNKPPLPEEEIRRTVNSIARSERSKRASEALVSGQDVDIKQMNDSDAREVILNALTTALDGVKIHRILKYLSESPMYVLETATGTIKLGDVTNLTSQTKFRNRIAELEGKYLCSIKPKNWDIIANNLLRICEDIEVSEEATDEGQTKGWLRAYLETNKPSQEFTTAALSGKPFIKDGSTYITLPHFLRYVVMSQMERGISQKQLAVRIKEIGSEKLTVRTSVKNVKAWKLPSLEEQS